MPKPEHIEIVSLYMDKNLLKECLRRNGIGKGELSSFIRGLLVKSIREDMKESITIPMQHKIQSDIEIVKDLQSKIFIFLQIAMKFLVSKAPIIPADEITGQNKIAIERYITLEKAVKEAMGKLQSSNTITDYQKDIIEKLSN